MYLVLKVEEDSIITDVVNHDSLAERSGDGNRRFQYDFTMCNPPFFSTEVEAWSDKHAAPSNSAFSTERACPGGEVYFVRKMILESVKLKDKIQ